MNTNNQSMGSADDKAHVSPSASPAKASTTAGGVTAPGVPSASKYTSGPWRVAVEIGPGYAKYKVVAHDSEEFVADCDGGNDCDLDAANARLIAAAPELLDVLQEIDQGLWQNFISVRKRPTLADITAIWELAQKWRAALSKVHP